MSGTVHKHLFEACREELKEVLEGWIVLGLSLGHELPEVDGLVGAIHPQGLPSVAFGHESPLVSWKEPEVIWLHTPRTLG
jgi:hypothetical protein